MRLNFQTALDGFLCRDTNLETEMRYIILFLMFVVWSVALYAADSFYPNMLISIGFVYGVMLMQKL